MMRAVLPSFAGAAALAGCVLVDGWYGAEQPPSAATMKTQFSHPAYICQPALDAALSADTAQRLVPPPARTLTRCSPVVVKDFLRSIADRGARISCLTISDVDAAGLPTRTDVSCKVSGGTLSPQWAAAYREAFQSGIDKAARRERFEPAPSAPMRRAYYAREYPVLNGQAAGFRGFAGIPQDFAEEAAP